MPAHCTDGDFRTRSGRCMRTNPWVQWLAHRGGAGDRWPPASSYRALARKDGLRRSDVAMTDHDRNAARDACAVFGAPASARSAAYDARDGAVRGGGDAPQRTRAQFPAQKHLQAHARALHALGWASPDPDGALPNAGASFTAPVLRTLVGVLDGVYFGGTLLPHADAHVGRPLRVRHTNATETSEDALMFYAPATHEIVVSRRLMFDRVALPIEYEEHQHTSALDWALGVLCHELTHVACFCTCAAGVACRRPSDHHGPQFARMYRTMFARGPPVEGAQIGSNVVVLARTPVSAVVAEPSRGARRSRGATDAETQDLAGAVRRHRRAGDKVYTVAWNGACVVQAKRAASPRTSPRKKRTNSRTRSNVRRRLDY